MKDSGSAILVARLLEWCEPFGPIGLDRKLVERLLPTTPITAFVEDKQMLPKKWHVGRIKHFLENPTNDPICIDNDCNGGWFGPPVLIDGHHRLCAAVLRGDKTIKATYGGLVATLTWLRGKRKTCPIE